MRPCTCNRISPDPLAPYTPARCRLCWLYHYDPAYRELWDALTPRADRPAGSATRAPCKHLGPEVRRQRCPTCRGAVELRLFACPLHTECTFATALPGIACCTNCPDHDPTEITS
jgi:hypothetical protein